MLLVCYMISKIAYYWITEHPYLWYTAEETCKNDIQKSDLVYFKDPQLGRFGNDVGMSAMKYKKS